MREQPAAVVPDARAQSILDSVGYLTLATVDEQGQPWNTPVAGFRASGDSTWYWASWRENQHSRNIRANGRAFVVVYDSTPSDGLPVTGVYLLGGAEELRDRDEVMRAALVFDGDRFNPSDGAAYLGAHPRRLYRFTPHRIWTNDAGLVNGEFVDVRVGAESHEASPTAPRPGAA